MKQKILKKQWQILISFYLKEANGISTQLHRNHATGVFLIMFENFFLVLCALLRHSDADLERLDPNLYFGIHQVKSALDLSTNSQKLLITVILIANITIIVLLILLIVFYAKEQRQKKHFEYLDQNTKGQDKDRNNKPKGFLKTLLRFISCYYRQVIFPISIFVSFLTISDPRGAINLLLTFIIGFFITDSDFSFVHFSKDCLAKPYHSAYSLVFIFEFFAILSIVFFNSSSFLIILWVFFVLRFIIESKISPYWQKSARLYNYWVILLSLGGISILYLGFHVFNTEKLSISFLFLIIDLPFSVVLSVSLIRFESSLMKREFQEIMKEEVTYDLKNNGLLKLDRIIRNCLFQTGDSLRQQDEFAIFLFSGVQQVDSSQDTDISNPTIALARQQLINRIASKFEIETKMKEHSHGFHLYLSFLLQIQNNYRLFWVISQKIRKQQGISIKNQQLIQSVCSQFKAYKRDLEERIARKDNVDDTDQTVKNSEFMSDRQYKNPFYRGFMRVIEFEEHISVSYQLINQASKLKLDLLETMKCRYINSRQLCKQIDELEEKLTLIRQNIIQAYLINPRSAQVADLQVIFMKSLAFTSDESVLKRPRSFNRGSERFQGGGSQQYNNGEHQMFERNQCVVFTGIEEQFELKTQQVSRNFKRLFRFEPREIINQPIGQIMLGRLGNIHHQYVKSYLTQTDSQRVMLKGKIYEKSSQNDSNVSDDFLPRMKDKQIFALINSPKSGFLITAVQVEVKLNTSNLGQLGFGARIRVLNNGLDYIVFSANNLQTLGVTENVFNQFEKVNKDFCSSQERFKIKQLFPFLMSIQEGNNQGQSERKQWIEMIRSSIGNQMFSCFVVMGEKVNSRKTFKYGQDKGKQQIKLDDLQMVKAVKTDLEPMKNDFQNSTTQEIILLNDQQSNQTTAREGNTTVIEQEDNSSKSDSNNRMVVFSVDIQLLELDYQDLKEMFAIQISKIRQLKQGESMQEVQKYVQKFYYAYQQFYSQEQLQIFLGSQQYYYSQPQQMASQQKAENQLKKLAVTHKTTFPVVVPDEELSLQELHCLSTNDYNNNNNNNNNNQNYLNTNTLQFLSIQSQDNFNEEEKLKIDFDTRNQLNKSLLHTSNQELAKSPKILLAQSPMSIVISENGMIDETKRKEDHRDKQPPYFTQASKSQNQLVKTSKSSGGMRSKRSMGMLPGSSSTTNTTQEQTESQEATQQQFSTLNTQRRLMNNTATIVEETEQAEQVSSISKIQQFLQMKRNSKILRQETQSSENGNQLQNKVKQKNNNADSETQNAENNNENNINDDFDDESENEGTIQGDHERKQLDMHAEIESHRSKASSTASVAQMKNYVKMLSGREKSQAILVINYIGYLCYIIMVGLTVLTYVQVDEQLSSSFYDNAYSVWPMKYSWILSNLFINQNMQLLISQGDVNSYPSLPTAAAKATYVAETHAQGPEILLSWKQLLADSFRIGQTRGIFKFYMENYNVVMFQGLYNKTTISGASSVPTGVPVFEMNDTVLNSGPLMMSMLHRYTGGFVENTEYYVTTNSMNVVTSLKVILTSIADQFEYSNSYIKTNQVQLMIVVIVISFCCLLSLIPLYAFIQFRRDKIIELFSTFSIIEIEAMAQSIQQSLLNSRNMMKSIRSVPQITKKATDPKRQPLGSIRTMSKMSFPLMIIAAIGYVLILSGPITNNLLTSKYITQTQFLLYNKSKFFKKIRCFFWNIVIVSLTDRTGRINEIRAHSQNILQINYQCLILKIQPASKLVPLSLYMSKVAAQLARIQYYTDFLTGIINDQENLQKIDEDFHNFFFPAIENNICKAFQDYPQYITSTAQTLLNTCTTIKSGILQQGFSISMRTFYSLFPTLSAFYNLKTTAEITAALNQINTYLDIKDFNDFNVFLQEVVETLSSFIVLQYQKKFDFIRNIQLGIMVYELFLMTLIFLFGWWKFAGHLNRQFARTQKQLRVLNINYLVENNYVIAYFKKHHKS